MQKYAIIGKGVVVTIKTPAKITKARRLLDRINCLLEQLAGLLMIEQRP